MIGGAMADAKSLVEGIYILTEWHTGETVLRPPVVDGRFVLQDGVVITVLNNRSQPASRVAVAAYGTYPLDASGFSYKYDEGTVVTETTEARVSHAPLFDGTRSF